MCHTHAISLMYMYYVCRSVMYTYLLKNMKTRTSLRNQGNCRLIGGGGGGGGNSKSEKLERRTACTEVFMGGLVSSCLG